MSDHGRSRAELVANISSFYCIKYEHAHHQSVLTKTQSALSLVPGQQDSKWKTPISGCSLPTSQHHHTRTVHLARLPPIVCTVLAQDCVASRKNIIIKTFADDTAMIGRIASGL